MRRGERAHVCMVLWVGLLSRAVGAVFPGGSQPKQSSLTRSSCGLTDLSPEEAGDDCRIRSGTKSVVFYRQYGDAAHLWSFNLFEVPQGSGTICLERKAHRTNYHVI